LQVSRIERQKIITTNISLCIREGNHLGHRLAPQRDDQRLSRGVNPFATVRRVRHQAYLKLAIEPGDCMQIDQATHSLMRIGEEELFNFFNLVIHDIPLYGHRG
jgi:hypothetical protein